MFQDSSIEEMPVVLDRLPDSVSDLFQDAGVWFDPVDYPLREGDPDCDRISPSLKKTVQSDFTTRKATLHALQTLNSGNALRRIALHPDGETLLSVGSLTRTSPSELTNTVQIWNWRTGQRLFSLQGHTAPITAMALSQDGKTLVTGSQDCTIKVWQVATGEELTTLKGHHSPITAIAISADGQMVVSSGCNQYEWLGRRADLTVRDRSLRIWNLPQGENTHILPCLTDVPILAVAMSGKGLLKIEQRPEAISLKTGEARFSLNWLTPYEQWLDMTPDWQRVATIVGRQVWIRKVATGEIRCRIQLDPADGAPHVAALSPDGQWFVAGYQRVDIHPKHRNYARRQNLLRIWDAETGQLLNSLGQADLGQGLWQAVQFSQNSRYLVTSVESGLKVWQCDR